MVPKICSMDGCDKQSKGRGLCGPHYSAWYKATPPAERTQPTRSERFWSKVSKPADPEGCWHWGATRTDTGYGTFHDGSRLVKAHRYSYEMANGHIAPGLVIDHVCHNDSLCTDVPCAHRKCVNPAHLEAVTQKINSIRGRSGDHQSRKTHCPSGHEYTPENILAKPGKPNHRGCRECSRIANRKYYEAKRKAA